MNIGIDIDETINNLITCILEKYNNAYKDNIEYKNIKDWNIEKFIKPECKNIFSEFCTSELISSLSIVDGAKETIEKLRKKHSIYFVTASFSESISDKHKWLTKHFDWYEDKHLVKCTRKQLLNLDILIDDCVFNLSGGKYIGILLDKPWNTKFKVYLQHISKMHYVNNWDEILKMIGA